MFTHLMLFINPNIIQNLASGIGDLSDLVSKSFQQGNFIPIFGVLLLVGLAINLTPCVYPIIPITISFFANQAQSSAIGRFRLGLAYMIGIAITFGILGGIAASLGGAFGAIFTKAWFLYILAGLLFVLGLSMFDVYQINLPQSISRSIKARTGIWGAFIMGLFVGLVAAPCSGPLIVAVFAEVAKLQNVVLGILTFLAIGLGLGLPYVFLAAFSSSIQTLPKSGTWLKIVKAALGFIVMGVALNYLLPALPRNFVENYRILIWAIFYAIVAIYFILPYIIGAYLTPSDKEKEAITKKSLTSIGLIFLASGFIIGSAFQMNWIVGLIIAVLEIPILIYFMFFTRLPASKESRILIGFILLFCGFQMGAGYMKYKMNTSPLPSNTLTKINWIPFNAKTFEEAKASGKPIFIDVTANWCEVCQKIERDVFEQPEAVKALQNIITMRIDWSTGVEQSYQDYTQDLFHMPGPPYFIFLKPGGEKALETSNLRTVQDLMQYLNKSGFH